MMVGLHSGEHSTPKTSQALAPNHRSPPYCIHAMPRSPIRRHSAALTGVGQVALLHQRIQERVLPQLPPSRGVVER